MLKTTVRNALPLRLQVPLKFFYSQARGWLEPEVSLLPRLVSAGDHAIDIGGNWGIYSYALAALKANVSIFEPNPQCFRALTSWSKHKTNVDVYPFALSSYTGDRQLHIPVGSYGQEHDASASLESRCLERFRSLDVQTTTLDAFAFQAVKFIKIDVEGHELEVLRGSTKTIRSSMPVMLIEIEQRHNIIDISEIFTFVSGLGYDCFFLDHTLLRSIESFDVNKYQPVSFPSANANRYINNFLFIPRVSPRFAEIASRLNFVL